MSESINSEDEVSLPTSAQEVVMDQAEEALKCFKISPVSGSPLDAFQ